MVSMESVREARSVAVVINAASRRGAAAATSAVDFLKQAGVPVSAVHPVTSGAEVTGVLDRVAAEEHDLVVVGGGDGTVSYAAGLLAGTDTVLGVLPLGTANDLARTLEIPNGLAEACAVIANGKVVDIDLGRANGQPFLNVASVGLSVGVTQALSPGSSDASVRWPMASPPFRPMPVTGRSVPGWSSRTATTQHWSWRTCSRSPWETAGIMAAAIQFPRWPGSTTTPWTSTPFLRRR